MNNQALLRVRELRVSYLQPGSHPIPVLRDVSFDLQEGEVVGLLGESGCGKTTLALSLLHILPSDAVIQAGTIHLGDNDLLAQKESAWEQIRGTKISLVFQEPGISLHPTMRVGDQLADALRVHRRWPRRRCRDEALAALARVRLDDPLHFYPAYPHQLSGGQRQRVLIALALICGPALLVADEPTASLDTTVQAEIVRLIRELKNEMGLTVLWITHNPGLLTQIAGRVLVMYAGQIVECGSLPQMYSSPKHPYTQALLASRPRRRTPGAADGPRFANLGGEPSTRSAMACGCAFAAACPDKMDICSKREPPEIHLSETSTVRCFKYGG